MQDLIWFGNIWSERGDCISSLKRTQRIKDINMKYGLIIVHLLAANAQWQCNTFFFFLIFFLKSTKISLTKYHRSHIQFCNCLLFPTSSETAKRQCKPKQPQVEGSSFKLKWTFRETSYSMRWILSSLCRNSQLELCCALPASKPAGHLPASLFYANSQLPEVHAAASIHFTLQLAVSC